MTTGRVAELKTLLSQLASQAEPDDEEYTADEEALRDAVVADFTAAGPELLDQATPYLWEYYRWIASLVAPDERAEYGIPEISETADIWEHVEFHFPPAWHPGGRPLEPGRSYLSFEGNVSWEVEHGLQLVFADGEDGLRVCKVSPYDGHLTVAHAYGDPSLLGVVFR